MSDFNSTAISDDLGNTDWAVETPTARLFRILEEESQYTVDSTALNRAENRRGMEFAPIPPEEFLPQTGRVQQTPYASEIAAGSTRLREMQDAADSRGEGTQWIKTATGYRAETAAGFVRKPDPSLTVPVGVPREGDEGTALVDMKARMLAITKMTDPDEKFGALSQLQGAVAGFIATKEREGMTLADQTAGVARLYAALQLNINADKNNPAYFAKYGTKYSRETEDAQKQYQSAVNTSNSLFTKFIGSDPEIASVKAEVESFIKIQGAITTGDYTRAQKAKEYGEGVRWVASVVNPGATADDLHANIGKYTALKELSENPEVLVATVIEGKLPAAAVMMAHIQAATTSGTKDMKSAEYQVALKKAQSDIQSVQRIVTDEMSFQSAYLSKYPVTGAGASDANRALQVALVLLKTEPKAYLAFKKDFALEFAQTATKNRFLGNVDSWDTKNELGQATAPFSVEGTPLNQVYTSLQKKGAKEGDISVKMLMSEIRLLPKEEQARAEEALVKVMRGGLVHAAPGYFGGMLANVNAKTYIDALIVREVLKRSFGEQMLDSIYQPQAFIEAYGDEDYFTSVRDRARQHTDNILAGPSFLQRGR